MYTMRNRQRRSWSRVQLPWSGLIGIYPLIELSGDRSDLILVALRCGAHLTPSGTFLSKHEDSPSLRSDWLRRDPFHETSTRDINALPRMERTDSIGSTYAIGSCVGPSLVRPKLSAFSCSGGAPAANRQSEIRLFPNTLGVSLAGNTTTWEPGRVPCQSPVHTGFYGKGHSDGKRGAIPGHTPELQRSRRASK